MSHLAANSQRQSVLVVDDDIDSLEITAFMLEQLSLDVIRASSAIAALKIFEQRVPNLLISDIGMPEMDGYMLIQRIRQYSPGKGGNVPAIALTAYASSKDNDRAIQAGFQRYITKPVEPEALIQAVREMIL